MRGRPLRAAVTAARRFVRHRNPGQPVAVVTFAGATRVVQPFTTRPGRHRPGARRHPEAERGSHPSLDAVGAAIALIAVRAVESGSLVVLSDGGDHGSLTTLERRHEGGLRRRRAHLRDRPALARQRLRHAEPARGGDARRVLVRGVDQGPHAHLRPARLPPRRPVSDPLPLERGPARARRGGASASRGLAGTASAVYETPAPRPAGREPFHRSPARCSGDRPAAVAIAIVDRRAARRLRALAARAAAGHLGRPRLAAYVDPPARPSPATSARPEGAHARRGGALARRDGVGRAAQGPARHRAHRGAAAAARRVRSWPARSSCCWRLTMIGGPAARTAGVRRARGHLDADLARGCAQQRLLFRDQLPDNLQIIASAMRAGHSFSGALSVVVEDAPEPTQRELRRVLADERLGVPARPGPAGGRVPHGQQGLRAGSAGRGAAARDGRQHGGGPRPRDGDRARPGCAAADDQDAHRPGPDVALGRLRAARGSAARASR